MDNGTPSDPVMNKEAQDLGGGWPWLFKWDLWECCTFGYIAPACILGWTIMVVTRSASKRSSINGVSGKGAQSNGSADGGLLWKVWQIVGLVALATTTLFLQLYLRILGHFQLSRPRSNPYDDIDSNANETRAPPEPITWRSRLKSLFSAEIARHICRFCQRFLTIQAVILLGVNIWPDNFYNQALLVVLALVLPRLIFSIVFVMKKRNLNPGKRPANPDRHVNMALMLLHHTYRAIRKIFKVLSGVEQILVYVCQCIEFVFLQLLGYHYRHPIISFFAELESLAVLGVLWYFNLSSFKYNFGTSLPTEIVLMSGLYGLRFSLKLFS